MANFRSLSVLLVFISLGNILGLGGTQTTATITDVVECNGTHNSLSFSGTTYYHYQRMRERYTGCTHVVGNLEITHLDNRSIDYDLSFLQDIRYVSGYVLIALVTRVPEIPLHSLEIIRGNNTFSSTTHGDYALVVFLNYPRGDRTAGLKELQLPSLREISNGKVAFQLNPSLGFVDTIDWRAIVRHRPNAVDFLNGPYNASVSSATVSFDCPSGRMWARGMCQSDVPQIQCHPTCDNRCFGSASGQCCHATCAAGCHGPTNQDCLLCKDYKYSSGCVGFCPAGTHPEGQNCLPNIFYI